MDKILFYLALAKLVVYCIGFALVIIILKDIKTTATDFATMVGDMYDDLARKERDNGQ